jgi:GTPase SAR1 family protein
LNNSTFVINYNLKSTIEEFRRSQNVIDLKSNFRSFTLRRGRPQNNDWENKPKLRIIISLLGATSVGKSYLAANAEYGLPLQDNKMRVTLALDVSFFYLDQLFEGEYVVIVQINDCPGNDRFESVSDRHFRNCHGAVLMIDTTSMDTFERLEGYWYKRLREKTSFDSVETVLACNKIDLLENYDSSYREQLFKQADTFAAQYQMPICNISALRGDNVQAMFHQLISSILENPILLKHLKETQTKSDKQQSASQTSTIQVTSSPKTSTKRNGNQPCTC